MTHAPNPCAADAPPQTHGPTDPGRRAFVAASAAGLVVPFFVTLDPKNAQAAARTRITSDARLGAYIRVDPSNNVTVAIGATEMGQGIFTGLSQLVAEELGLNWSQVRAEHAPITADMPNPYANPLFGWQLTGGSTSMMGWYQPMRKAAAITRDLLIRAAAQTYGGVWTLGLGGTLVQGATTIQFADVAGVAMGLVPASSVAQVATTRVIGQRVPRLDIPAKVTGQAVFGIDVRVPGMVHATVVHCPTLGGTVSALPAAPAGTQLVNLGNAVGIVAADTWTAMRAISTVASTTTWVLPASTASRDSAALETAMTTLVTSTTATPYVAEVVGSPNPQALARKIDVTYSLPFLAHACMEVLNCTASVTPTACEIWAPTQGQQFIIPLAAAITGLPSSAITAHTTYLGGGFGRKIETDYVEQAIRISKAVGKPVKLTWSRTQDFQNDRYRPCARIRVQAGLDATNGIAAMIYRNVSPSINIQHGQTTSQNPEDTGAVAGAVKLPYRMAARQIEYVPLYPMDIPLGYWRSVGESYNTFAVESAIDELAKLAALDPLAYRKTLLAGGDARALGVLTAVETLSKWATAPARGIARGVAFLKGFGSYIALVAEVASVSSKISVKTVHVAIDCGIAVNPDQIEAQLQGGILHGLSTALYSQVRFVAGKPQISNFPQYPMLRLNQAPVINVKIVTSTAAPGGVGETGVPCVAPAVANAWAKLTGVRLRSLPFYPGTVMGGD